MSAFDDQINRLSPRRMFQKVPGFILYRPLLVNALVLAATLLMAWPLPRLRFETTVYDLVLEDLQETRQYEEFKKIFGSDEIIRIVVRAEDIFDGPTFRAVELLSDAGGKIPGVRRVLSLPEIKKLVDTKGKRSLSEFAAIVEPVSLFQRNLISEDRTATVITLVLDRSADNRIVIAAVRELLDKAPGKLSLYQIGMPLVSEALAHFSETDFLRIPPLTIVIIAALLALLMRSVICLVVPLLTIMIAQVWTFGLMAWMGIPLSMLTMIVPVFFIAVGTAYCLHICTDYLNVSLTASDSREAVSISFGRLAFPTVLAVATTVIGLGSLAINRIEAIREFAFFACFGMISLVVIILTLFPATLVLLPLPAGRGRTGQTFSDRWLDRLLLWIVHLIIYHQKTCLTVFLIVSLICGIGVFRVRVETNPVGYFKPDVPVVRHFHDIYKDLSGSFPINVVMKGGTEYFFEDLENVRMMARLQQFLETLPGVDKTVSFVDYLKLVNYTLNRFEPRYYTLPEESFELSMLINNFKMILGDDLLRRFMAPDFSRSNTLLLTHISNSRGFLDTRKEILAHVKNEYPRTFVCEVTGLGLVISSSSHFLTSGQIKSLLLALILIFVIMAMLFLSSTVGLIAMLPNLFPILVNFGVMGWLGVHLSVATSLIASIAIGLAVDDTIHYLVRYHAEFKKDLDKQRAMKDTILHVGKPIIFTTLTISLGFSILMFSHFQPTSLFGLMMVITIFSALVGDLILLPLMIQHVELVTAWDLIKLIPTLGHMPPGIAHELNQPLNAIKVGSQFLKMMADKGSGIKEDQLLKVAGQISSQVDRASAIINRLQVFTPKQERKAEPIDLNQPVKEIESIMRDQLHVENIKLKLELAEPLPPIIADTNRLIQILFNIITNAAEATIKRDKTSDDDGEGRIVLRTFQEKKSILLAVSDTGTGMPAHVKEKIFQPFFTTKAAGGGKGLGLTNCLEIVRDFDGQISVESRVDEGTTVTIRFPAIRQGPC